uniref:BTB domain-containing protein n=1 Tax=Panagrolaimus sp. JU765 TaxID=591449 RepID=A0AC34Q4V0_9BILA
MTSEIVKKCQFVVPTKSLTDSKVFKCPEEQIESITVKWRASVRGVTRSTIHTFDNNGTWGWNDFGKRDQLSKNGVITILATFTVTLTPQMMKRMKPQPQLQSSNSLFQLQSSNSPLSEEKFKDFTIHVGNKEIKVHKCILAHSSIVFAAMFQQKSNQAVCQGNIVITDYNFETIKAAVNLMYKNEVDPGLSVNTLLNLNKFVIQYGLVAKERILTTLKKKISPETVLEISSFSKKNNMVPLYNSCLDFFGRNLESNISKMKNLDALEPEFAKDVIKKYHSYHKN